LLHAVLPKRHERNTLKYHLVTGEPPFVLKTIDCSRQDLGREDSILQYVTLRLDVYQVSHCVGRCVKCGSCFHQAWKSMDSIAGISSISTNGRCCETRRSGQSARQCTGASCVQHSPTPLVQNSQLPFSCATSDRI